jgi:hypothetical protein
VHLDQNLLALLHSSVDIISTILRLVLC